jgi:hypothetical protein
MMGDDRYGTTMDDHESYGHAAKTGTGIGFIIFGALLWVITTSLVSQCRADLSILTGGSGTCSGLPVYAYHLQSTLTIFSGILAGIGVLTLLSGRRRP